MKNTTKHILASILLLIPFCAKAQVSVEQSIDSVGILIGQQAHLRLWVSIPDGASLTWPKIKERQYIIPGVEVVDVTKPDTIVHEGNTLKVERRYTITSFNESLYAIPPLVVKVNGKKHKGTTSALKVVTMDVDTLHPYQFFGPKDVQNNPFLWTEWAPYFWLSFLVVILYVTAFYLFIRLKQNKPIITNIRIVRHIPPHKRALNEIEKIKTERMQASEDQKTYYTQLTGTLRKYIQERFGFNAMEMTSNEILEHLQNAGDRKMLDELRELFQTADLVKFAKYSTVLNENDMNLINAVNFIDSTKLEDKEVEERIVPKLTDDDRKKRSNRITIKAILWAIGIMGALLMAYVIYNIYLLTI